MTYQLWQGDRWQVFITVIALAVGYACYYAYLHTRRQHRWTMP